MKAIEREVAKLSAMKAAAGFASDTPISVICDQATGKTSVCAFDLTVALSVEKTGFVARVFVSGFDAKYSGNGRGETAKAAYKAAYRIARDCRAFEEFPLFHKA